MFSRYLKETLVGPAGLVGLEGLVGLVSLVSMVGPVGLVGMLANSGYFLAILTDPKYFQSKYCLCCSKRILPSLVSDDLKVNSNESMNFNYPKEFDDPQLFNDPKEISI